MAIWLFYCFIWNNPQILSCLKKKIQHRLNQIPNNDEGLDKQDSTIHQQSVDDLQPVTDV
jgi:hypothetical protein